MNVSSSFSLNSSARPSLGFVCLIECASVEMFFFEFEFEFEC